MEFYKRILCPVDFSEASLAALDTAVEMAAHFGADLIALHVIPSRQTGSEPVSLAVDGVLESSGDRQNEALGRLRSVVTDHIPPDVAIGHEAEVRFGDAADEIVQAAREEADMVVISSHGRTGWRHLVFGSVAERVIRTASCPVLTVRATPGPEKGHRIAAGLERLLHHAEGSSITDNGKPPLSDPGQPF